LQDQPGSCGASRSDDGGWKKKKRTPNRPESQNLKSGDVGFRLRVS
jgi:hypothetical protein